MPIRLPSGDVKKLEFREKLSARDTDLGVISLRMVSKTMRPRGSECRERRGPWLFLEHSSVRKWKEE